MEKKMMKTTVRSVPDGSDNQYLILFVLIVIFNTKTSIDIELCTFKGDNLLEDDKNMQLNHGRFAHYREGN